MIPDSLRTALTHALNAPIRSIERIGGGDINQAARVETAQARCFVKWNPHAPPRMFEVEARGLRLLQSAQAVRVPGVIAVLEQPAGLVLEWIDADPHVSRLEASETLGRQLAQQHRALNAAYGLDHDNYIGSSPQSNQPTAGWVDFFRDRRLGAQQELARRNGRLHSRRAAQLERLRLHLAEWIDEEDCAPSLLHGDLWGGNYLAGLRGEPVLIDPAVYYGDREAEIAFTELFGGFGSNFYAAYNEAWPLGPGYSERRDLYNLYHLLNHLNLFGEAYGGSVDAILLRFAGS